MTNDLLLTLCFAYETVCLSRVNKFRVVGSSNVTVIQTTKGPKEPVNESIPKKQSLQN
jgi:hypothetical protein